MEMEESELFAQELIECKEYHKAERLLIMLCDQGSVYAPMVLAWIYENGCMGEKNVRAAQHYYERASSLGRVDADFNLGHLLLDDGRESEARTVFERGSERGHLGCLGELGWMQVKGIGSDTPEPEGRKLLEKASSRGHLLAQGRIISLELSARPSFIKRIGLLKRKLTLMWKSFFELYNNKNSDKIW
jgi:TPR repeat protein